ncbi:MAG: AbrB/MazE/SpoVT family DNA-binding domain-containing protein [Bacillota bacterium]
MEYELMRVTAKGQLTIPINIRKKLNIRAGDYLQIHLAEKEIRIRKVEPVHPLSPNDPIWQMIGAGKSGQKDVSVNHDKYAEGELERWKG